MADFLETYSGFFLAESAIGFQKIRHSAILRLSLTGLAE